MPETTPVPAGRAPNADAPPVSVLAASLSSPAAIGLVVLMALGSVTMWLVTPIFWLWLASQMVTSSQPSLGPYLLVLAGIIVTMVALGKALGMLNRRHMHVTGLDRDKHREHRTWNRSMRDGRMPTRDKGVLEPLMMTSVAVASTLFGIWFFFFAGSSIG